MAEYPPTLPHNTILGRIAPAAGPAEAIPFAGLFAGFGFAPTLTTDKAIVRWSGVAGAAVQNSNALIDDTGNITPVNANTLSLGTSALPWANLFVGTSAQTPIVIGGSATSATLRLRATSGAGATDRVIVETGSQVESMSVETIPSSNTFTLAAGSKPGLTAIRAGTTQAGTGIFTTPGIGPAPSAGLLFVNGDYADSTSGNISNIFAVAYNLGTRFTAAITGIGVLRTGTVAGNAWGGQFSAIGQGNAAGILQGVNIECDYSTGAGTYIGATIKLGDSVGGVTVNPGNSYINCLADTGKTPITGLRFQATSFTSTNTQNVLNVEGGSAVNGINLSSMTITTSAFLSPGFALSGAGNPLFLSTTAIPAGGTTGAGLKMGSTNNNGIFFGSGVPTLNAAKGSIYLRSDGSTTTTRCYVNTDGGGAWTNFITTA